MKNATGGTKAILGVLLCCLLISVGFNVWYLTNRSLSGYELSSCRNQLQSCQSQLSSAQSQLQSCESQVSSAQNQLQKTILADQTVVVPVGVEDAANVYFDIPKAGVVKATIDVISGHKISYYLHWDPPDQYLRTVAKGENILNSHFEAPIDTGSYKLVIVAYRWNQPDIDRERTVRVHLELES